MIGVVVLVCLMAASFGAGYVTRASLSRKRRSIYLNYQPYLAPRRSQRRSTVPIPPQGESADGVR